MNQSEIKLFREATNTSSYDEEAALTDKTCQTEKATSKRSGSSELCYHLSGIILFATLTKIYTQSFYSEITLSLEIKLAILLALVVIVDFSKGSFLDYYLLLLNVLHISFNVSNTGSSDSAKHMATTSSLNNGSILIQGHSAVTSGFLLIRNTYLAFHVAGSAFRVVKENPSSHVTVHKLLKFGIYFLLLNYFMLQWTELLANNYYPNQYRAIDIFKFINLYFPIALGFLSFALCLHHLHMYLCAYLQDFIAYYGGTSHTITLDPSSLEFSRETSETVLAVSLYCLAMTLMYQTSVENLVTGVFLTVIMQLALK